MARNAKQSVSRTRPAAGIPPTAGEFRAASRSDARPSDPIRRARAAGKHVGIALPRVRARLALPDELADLLADALDAHALGHRVGLVVHVHSAEPPNPYLILDRDPNDELTTQEAAAALRVSRPTIIKAIDEGRLPARKVGKHRRVRIYDFNAYARAEQAARVAHAMESDRIEQELGLYELPLPASRAQWNSLIATPPPGRTKRRATRRGR
jgi:excisionase family DNA binding protein